jgi:large subunit ribosomal protein L17
MRPLIERLVHRAKRGEKQDYNFVFATLFTNDACKRLYNEIAPRFVDTPGGFTRVEYLGRRDNDKAEMAMIEFTKNPIREYEQNEEQLEIDDFQLKTFW